jgi:hypothetical protein
MKRTLEIWRQTADTTFIWVKIHGRRSWHRKPTLQKRKKKKKKKRKEKKKKL